MTTAISWRAWDGYDHMHLGPWCHIQKNVLEHFILKIFSLSLRLVSQWEPSQSKWVFPTTKQSQWFPKTITCRCRVMGNQSTKIYAFWYFGNSHEIRSESFTSGITHCFHSFLAVLINIFPCISDGQSWCVCENTVHSSIIDMLARNNFWECLLHHIRGNIGKSICCNIFNRLENKIHYIQT